MTKLILFLAVILLFSGCIKTTEKGSSEKCLEIFEKYSAKDPYVRDSGESAPDSIAGPVQDYWDEHTELSDNDCTLKISKETTEVYHRATLAGTFPTPKWRADTLTEEDQIAIIPNRIYTPDWEK